MSIVRQLTIWTNHIAVLPEDRENLQISRQIASACKQLGINAEIVDYSEKARFGSGPDEHLYAIEIPVSKELSHRAILDISVNQNWIRASDLSKYEKSLSRFEKEFKLASDTEEKATTGQSDFIADFIDPYVDGIIQKFDDRISPLEILMLACVSDDPSFIMEVYKNNFIHLNPSFRTIKDLEEINDLVKVLRKVCNRDESLLSTFTRLGGFLPSEERIREIFISQVNKQLDKKFGKSTASLEDQRGALMRELAFIKGIPRGMMFSSPESEEILAEANRKFPTLKPLLNPFQGCVRFAKRATVPLEDEKEQNKSNQAPLTSTVSDPGDAKQEAKPNDRAVATLNPHGNSLNTSVSQAPVSVDSHQLSMEPNPNSVASSTVTSDSPVEAPVSSLSSAQSQVFFGPAPNQSGITNHAPKSDKKDKSCIIL